MEEAHERKLLRYTDPRLECEARGWECSLYAVEVGCRGFVGRSTASLLSHLGVRGKERKRVIADLGTTAECCSSGILRKFQFQG